MNKASFSLYSPQGVRVYFEAEAEEYMPGKVADLIKSAMGVGYTVQEPVPSEGEKRYRITRYTKASQATETGDALPVLNLWSDNGEYPQLTVWPTTFLEDGTQIVADIEHLFDMSVPLCEQTMRSKVHGTAWGKCNLVAIGVPKVDYEGNVEMTSAGRVKYRFHHIEGAGTKSPAPSTNGSGPAAAESDSLKTWQKWTSKQDAIDWSVDSGASTNEHSAQNAMGNAVMQVLGDKNARPENKQQCEAIYQAFYFERMERLNSRMDEAAQPDEELPF